MNINDFSYMRCLTCGNVTIVPIPYENNYTLLSSMSYLYDEMNKCCDNTYTYYGSIGLGIECDEIKITDLPLKLRKEFPPEVTHEFACGKHLLFITKYNGDKVLIHVDGERIIILDGMTENSIYIGEDKND